MSIKYRYDLSGNCSGPVVEEWTLGTTSAIIAGMVFKHGTEINNAIPVTDAIDDVLGISVADVEAGTVSAGRLVKLYRVTPYQVWEAPYSGTPAAGFLPGKNTVDIASSSDMVDAADVVDGTLYLLQKDTKGQTCKFCFTGTVISKG
ncbi:MAG: hypothetical protein JXA60_03295 [Candidatus Coatesbacteria bacterium]|nr:hypothetical protein [Candidatus Coatesbacteria bacterium]